MGTEERIDRYTQIKQQLEVLHELQPKFGGRTLDNIIQNLEADVNLYFPASKKLIDCDFGKYLTIRILNVCFLYNVRTLGDLAHSKFTLMKDRRLGKKSFFAIKEYFKKNYNYDW